MPAAVAAAEGPLPEFRPWLAAAERPDPISLLTQQEQRHLSWLIPERHRCMAEGPLACFRGSAVVMAWDLAVAPHSGVEVQLCGDAQLLNFAFFNGVDGRLIFDIHAFDACCCGPFEWDLKRLVCSLVLAARSLQLPEAYQEQLARHGARSYRRTMRRLAKRSRLKVWFERRDPEARIRRLPDQPLRRQLLALTGALNERDSRRRWRGLCESGPNGRLRFRHDPPLLWRHGELAEAIGPSGEDGPSIEEAFATYRANLPPHGRTFLSGYRISDSAIQAVGLGSVSSHRTIVLLQGSRPDDVLLLECQQAETCQADGQRLMQGGVDPLLGWSGDGQRDPLVWRQFRTGRGVVQISQLDADGLDRYGRLCAGTLARAHARSGDRCAVAAHMADGKAFDRAMASWALAYADQATRDYQRLLEAIATGRISSSPA